MLQNSIWARQPPFIECEIRIEFIFIYFFNNIKFVLVYYIVVALTVHDDYWIISSWNLLIIINTILNLNTICILSGFIDNLHTFVSICWESGSSWSGCSI